MHGKAGFIGWLSRIYWLCGSVEVGQHKVVRNIEVILFLYSYCNIPVMTVCLSLFLKDSKYIVVDVTVVN